MCVYTQFMVHKDQASFSSHYLSSPLIGDENSQCVFLQPLLFLQFKMLQSVRTYWCTFPAGFFTASYWHLLVFVYQSSVLTPCFYMQHNSFCKVHLLYRKWLKYIHHVCVYDDMLQLLLVRLLYSKAISFSLPPDLVVILVSVLMCSTDLKQ